MIKIVIIGSGNVAQHLITAFSGNAETELVQVFSRTISAIAKASTDFDVTDNFENLAEADLYIIAVSDDAIASVSEQLPFEKRLVVHTSGSASLKQINSKNRSGVFYPLQSFSKNKAVDFSAIPICLESQFAEDYQILEKVANSISRKVYNINSDQRKSLHVAAVFVNNFTNHLYKIADDICAEHSVPFEILKPLIKETAAKIESLSPIEAQTGPAKRNDQSTINAHLELLSDDNQKNIYRILTQSIQENGEKL